LSGYLRHIELSKQLEERAKEASRNRQLAEQKLEELQKLLEGAKRADCQVGEAEELLAQANSAMAAKDYRLALEKTKDAEDKVKAAFLQKAQSILDSAESMLGLLKRAGVDTSEYEALVGSAKDALEKGNFEEAVETAKRGWTKGEKMLHEHLSSSFSSAQALILAAKAMNKDTSMAEDLLSTARTALESSDYEEALSQTEEALDILRRDLNYELEEEKKAVKELMEAGKAIKADLSKAESYLSRSEKEMERQDFEKAFNLLKQARTEAERELKKTIESGEASLKGPLEEAKKLGADVSKAERLVKEAMEVAKEGDYAAASGIIRRAVHELEDAKFQKVLHTISLSRPKFLKAREIGADVSAAVQVFNKSREALQAGNYKDALYYAEKGNEELDRLVSEFASARRKMEDLEREVRSFAEQGVHVSEVDALLRTAREELSKGNLKSWSSLMARIEKGLEKARSQRTSELLEEAQFLLTLGERLGLVISEESGGLHECSQALKAGEVSRAFQDALRLKDRLEERISSHFTERLNGIREILPEGEDLDEISELILKAQTALEVKDYDTAARLTGEAESKAMTRASEAASDILKALQAAQQLSMDHGIEAYGLREGHLAAKRALEAGNFGDVFGQLKTLEDQLSRVAQTAFDGVKARVIEARNSGIDIEDLKDLLRSAKDSITAGDIVRGLIHLYECDISAQEKLNLFQKVRDTMASAAVLIAEGKKKQVDMSRAIELLVKGKTAFEAGDLKRALEYARDARAEAEKEISVLNVTDRILTAREILELARVLDVDVSVWTNLLKRAQQSLDAKDFREAVELAMEVEEQARSGIRNKINSKIARAEALLERVQVPAKDVESLQDAIKAARALAEEGNLKEAAEAVQNAVEKCEELARTYERTLDVVKRAETLVAELKAMNVRVSGPEKLLSKAKKVLQEGNLKHAGQLAEEALSHLERDREESIERTIKSFEGAVAKAKANGINTATAEQLLKRARDLVREKRYQEALAAAMQSEAEVEKMELQKEIAENALETARTRIMALPSPVPFLTKLLEEAEQAFERGDYVASLEAAIKAGDEFSRIREGWEQAEKSEEVALRFYRIAERIGVDSTRLSAILEEAKEAMERGDLEAAKDAYDRLATQAAGLASSHLTQLHSQVRNLQVLCSLLNCEVEGLEDMLSQGRSYTDENQFDKAYEVLSQARKEAERVLRERIEGLLSEAEEAIEHAEKVGADVHHARQMFEDARKALQEGMYEKAIRLAQESTDLVKGQEDFHRRFMESTFQAESLIKKAKKFGIDVKAAEKALRKAFELKDSDPDAALEEAEASLNQVQSSLEAFSPVLELSLEIGEATLGTWKEAVLKLRNEGKALAKDVSVEILGDLEVDDLQVPASIRANGEGEARFKVRLNSAGNQPVMVKVKAKRVLDDREYEWERVFEIPVEGTAPREEARAIIAEYDTRCVLCRGAIKKGFSAKECVCGALLHEPCALRSGKCPSCHRVL
jgi:tetratricopeptide (TPR) repeat protein